SNIEAHVGFGFNAVHELELAVGIAGKLDDEANEAVLLVDLGIARLDDAHLHLLELGDRHALGDDHAARRAAEPGENRSYGADELLRAGQEHGVALVVDAAADAHAVVGAEAELERLALADEAEARPADHGGAARQTNRPGEERPRTDEG